MAFVDTFGFVENLKVGSTSGYIEIRMDPSEVPPTESFVIWDLRFNVPEDEADLLATDWIRFSMQVSLAREALIGRLRVRVNHDEDSAIVEALEIQAPTGS